MSLTNEEFYAQAFQKAVDGKYDFKFTRPDFSIDMRQSIVGETPVMKIAFNINGALVEINSANAVDNTTIHFLKIKLAEIPAESSGSEPS